MSEGFSVVVPVYNRSALMLRCLDAVKGQSYRPLHFIIVDNGSTDDSYQKAVDWKEKNESEGFKISVVLEPKRGACAARNRGLELVDTDHMCFFDSDDAMRESLVEECMAAFTAHPGADIVYWKVMSHPLEGKPFEMKYCTSNDIMWNHLIHAVLRTQGYGMRTETVRRAGGWNETLPVWNDWELGVRLLLGGAVCVECDRVLADSYAQRESITGTGVEQRPGDWEKSLDAAEKAIRAHGRHDLLGVVDYRRAVLAALYARGGAWQNAEALMKGIHRRRLLMNLVYAYTRMGYRGASRWARLPLALSAMQGV